MLARENFPTTHSKCFQGAIARARSIWFKRVGSGFDEFRLLRNDPTENQGVQVSSLHSWRKAANGLTVGSMFLHRGRLPKGHCGHGFQLVYV